MLVVTRKVGERVYVGDAIVVQIRGIEDGRVRVGIEAPREIPVLREELIAKAEAAASKEER